MITIRCIMGMRLRAVSKDLHDIIFSESHGAVPFSDKTPTLELHKRKPQIVIRTIECPSLKWPGVHLDRAFMCSITCFEAFSCYFSI